MTYQTIAVDNSARRIATIRLNRPDRGNAFDQTMLDELGHALATLAGGDSRVVVLRGNGRHFCTGADLATRSGARDDAPRATKPVSLREVLAALDALPKPTVALVHGAAIGGGAAFAACCDIAIAAESAFSRFRRYASGCRRLGLRPS